MNYVDFPEFYALEELSEVYILLIKKGNMGPICLFQYASNPKWKEQAHKPIAAMHPTDQKARSAKSSKAFRSFI